MKPHTKRNYVHGDKFPAQEAAMHLCNRIRAMIMFCTCMFNLFPMFCLILSILVATYVATFTNVNTCNKPVPKNF